MLLLCLLESQKRHSAECNYAVSANEIRKEKGKKQIKFLAVYDMRRAWGSRHSYRRKRISLVFFV